jgi:hypothetical protein
MVLGTSPRRFDHHSISALPPQMRGRPNLSDMKWFNRLLALNESKNESAGGSDQDTTDQN